MNITVYDVTLYTLIPFIVMIAGGILASLYVPFPKVSRISQHFVAGIVFAAVAIELIPEISHKSPLTVSIGFAIGALFMLCLQGFSSYMEKGEEEGESISYGMLFAVGVDLFVDGLLIGVSFLAGKNTGILIAISLSLCALFLAITTATSLDKKGLRFFSVLFWIVLLGLMLPIGGFVGGSILHYFQASILTETIAFGVAALLFLAAEELLVDAHEVKDSPWLTAPFFVGFLVILLFNM